MTETNSCPKCHAELPNNAPGGICPRCLMEAGLEKQRQTDSASNMTPTSLVPGFTPPEPEELAEHFPQLEILERVGQGGMGVVYKARQRELDRLVALKILPFEVGAKPGFAERFTREARALAKLNHPNIVPVFDSGATDGLYYIIMEYVDGVDLRRAMESGVIKPEQALAIVPQICEALQFAHDVGIVHRDIKPENILLDKQGHAKIVDFGLAKLLDTESSSGNPTLTGTQQAMGTLHYMAPEQMQGAAAVDHRADIFSLGVVFYEMLTGQLPIGKFQPPSHRIQVDVRLDDIVLKTLENEPSRRYQRASDVKSEVEQVGSTSHQSASENQSTLEVQRRPGSQDRSGRLLLLMPLWAKLAGWTAVIAVTCAWSMNLVFAHWWPYAYAERWEAGLTSQSGLLESILISGERTLTVRGQSGHVPEQLLSKTPWKATANIGVPESDGTLTISLDEFREVWSVNTLAGNVWISTQEPGPEAIDEWLQDTALEGGHPGLQAEIATLITVLKEAANGTWLGQKANTSRRLQGVSIGPLTTNSHNSWGLTPLGVEGLSPDADGNQLERRWLAAAVFCAIWLPGVIFLVRRNRAARK